MREEFLHRGEGNTVRRARPRRRLCGTALSGNAFRTRTTQALILISAAKLRGRRACTMRHWATPREHANTYDAVCCFQVIEHVRDPRGLFAEIVQAAKPGGVICVGVPQVPSALTRIPNFLVNAPPHHLTWWSKAALLELANGAGAVVQSIESVPWGSGDARVYWIERFRRSNVPTFTSAGPSNGTQPP